MTADSSDPFAAELKRWRDVRGISQKALAAKVNYTPSYVSKVEGGKQNPSTEFASEADRVLRAGGGLRRALSAREAWLRGRHDDCLLYTSPSPRDRQKSRMPSSA